MGEMPRQTIYPDGSLQYRTKLLSYEQASRFARCIAANRRFADVIVVRSEAVRESFIVRFRPVSTARLYDMADREFDKRMAKVQAEGGAYVYMLDTDGSRPFYWCLSVSGEVYELDSGDCSCPDFQFRLKRACWTGLKCKHQLEMMRRFETGELIPLADVYDLPEWQAKHPLPCPVESAQTAGNARDDRSMVGAGRTTR